MQKTSNTKFCYEREILRGLVYDIFGGSHSGIAVVCAAIIFVIAGWLPDGFKHLVTCFVTLHYDKDAAENYAGWVELVGSVALLLFGWQWIRRTSVPRRITVYEHSPAPAKVLIVFLSNLSDEALADINSKAANEITDRDQFLLWLQQLKRRNSWEMPLLALKHHQQALERLYIITSPTSEEQKGQFRAIVGRLFPGVEVADKQVDSFENAIAIYDATEQLYQDILAAGYRNDNIIMDITGGQKICSLIAGIFTTVDDRLCQHVSTGSKEVLAYDIRMMKDNEK